MQGRDLAGRSIVMGLVVRPCGGLGEGGGSGQRQVRDGVPDEGSDQGVLQPARPAVAGSER